MQREVRIEIKRGDLPEANVAFGLDEKDFDLSKTEIWIDGAPAPRGKPRQDPIKVKAPLGSGLGTIVATTEAGKFIGVVNYDRTTGKIVQPPGPEKITTVSGIVSHAVDKVVRAIKQIKPEDKEVDKIIKAAADAIVEAINKARAEEGVEAKK